VRERACPLLIFFKEIHEELQMVEKIFHSVKLRSYFYDCTIQRCIRVKNINDAGEPVPLRRDIQV
jgi:hypothetical protein